MLGILMKIANGQRALISIKNAFHYWTFWNPSRLKILTRIYSLSQNLTLFCTFRGEFSPLKKRLTSPNFTCLMFPKYSSYKKQLNLNRILKPEWGTKPFWIANAKDHRLQPYWLRISVNRETIIERALPKGIFSQFLLLCIPLWMIWDFN